MDEAVVAIVSTTIISTQVRNRTDGEEPLDRL